MRKIINIAFIFISTTAAFAQNRQEVRRDFQRTVTLAPGKSFRIENSLGNIRIRTQAQSQASTTASIRCSADSATEANSICDQIQIVVDDSAASVSVRTVYPSSLDRGRRNVGFGVDYDIALPDSTSFDVTNRFGNVSVSDVHAASTINNRNGNVSFSGGRGRQHIENAFGNVDVRSNNGDLTVRHSNGNATVSDITGDVDIVDRFGRVSLTRATGNVAINSRNGSVDVVSAGGNVSIANAFGSVAVSDAGGDVSVNNQNGAIRLTNVKGSADLRTSFDRINFTGIGKALTIRGANTTVTGDMVGESATIETTFGNVDVRGVKAATRVTTTNTSITLRDIGGEVFARTTFNGVTINNASGPVTVEGQNGAVVVEANSSRCQPISLSTTFAPIRVTVPNGIGYDVSARTTFGRISSDPPISVTSSTSRDSLSGTIGNGGCPLRLVGQNGNIEILRSR